MGPFDIVIPDKAISLDYKKLSKEHRDILLGGQSFSAKEHRLCKLEISIMLRANKYNRKKIRRKRGYEVVDQAVIDVETGSQALEILGIYPRHRQGSLNTPGLTVGDGDLLFELEITNQFRIKFSGPVKNLVRQQTAEVIATTQPNRAQWIFLKPYISSHTDFVLDLFCKVPKDLPQNRSYLLCHMTCQDSGRQVETAKRRRVDLT